MLTPGQLVVALSRVLGVSETTVAQCDRALAEAGLRTSSGRGTSAAKVSPRDAANLIIAIGGAPLLGSPIRDAVRTCRIYSKLPVDPKSTRDNFERLGLQSLVHLPKKHRFGDAVTALIAGASKGEKFKIPIPDGTYVDEPDVMFSILFQGASAEILADGGENEEDFDRMGRLSYYQPISKNEALRRISDYRSDVGDLQQTRKISFATIRTIGGLIGEKAADNE